MQMEKQFSFPIQQNDCMRRLGETGSKNDDTHCPINALGRGS